MDSGAEMYILYIDLVVIWNLKLKKMNKFLNESNFFPRNPGDQLISPSQIDFGLCFI